MINEVFDVKHTHDDIDVHNPLPDVYKFEFRDPNIPDSPIYTVKIRLNDLDDISFGDINVLATDYYKNPKSAEISLMTDRQMYNLTGYKNQYYVYGKMLYILLSAFKQFGRDNDIVMIEFAGYVPKMDLVYAKMLKHIARLDKRLIFVPFSENLFIRQEALDKLNDSEHSQIIGTEIGKAKDEYDKSLAFIRKNF